jgi:hypothetical protein
MAEFLVGGSLGLNKDWHAVGQGGAFGLAWQQFPHS